MKKEEKTTMSTKRKAYQIKKGLYRALGIFLPLITTNCAIMGLALLNVIKDYDFIRGVVFAVGAGIGFTIALIIMSGIRERLEFADVPGPLKGTPIALVVAG